MENTSVSTKHKVAYPEEPTVVVEPSHGWIDIRFGEIWQYRELLFFLVWRDLKVRYKQSVLGALWIIIQPLVTMILFTLIFNRVLGVESERRIPYPVFSYSALLPWLYFSNSLTRCSTSLVNNKNLISKIYFPRLIIPISSVLPGLVDFAISFVVLLGMMFFFNVIPGIEILALPIVLLLAVLTSFGVGLWLTALNVQYRDVQYLVPFIVQAWMYASPIIYPITRIPERWQWLYNLYPMVGVVQSFLRVLLNEASFMGINWISILITLAILISGMVYFRRTEKIFADVI
jgi:lipopolysaccharide transport system permease protein